MEKNIPSKLTSNRHNLPWINHKLKKLIKKKNKLYNKARQSKKKEEWDYYKVHKRHTQKALRQAHWEHVNTILEDSLESGNRKPFWKYIKAKKKVNIGVAPIKDKGQLYSDSQTKAELLNKQFKSVFKQEKTDEPLLKIPGKEYTKINRLDITTAGVQKLLANLNTNKMSGPDGLPNRIMKTSAEELAPAITEIYKRSLTTGTLPSDWRNASVSPIFKKGNKHEASNYR